MAPKGPQDHAPSYYTQSAGPYGQPGQANPYMPGASYGQPANDPYAQHSMPDPYALNSGQVHSPTRLLIQQAAPEAIYTQLTHQAELPWHMQGHPGHQPAYNIPSPQAPQQGFQQQGFLAPNDPLMAMGTSMLRQSGQTYLESGKRYMQSWTGILSGAMMQHEFDISSSYGVCFQEDDTSCPCVPAWDTCCKRCTSCC